MANEILVFNWTFIVIFVLVWLQWSVNNATPVYNDQVRSDGTFLLNEPSVFYKLIMKIISADNATLCSVCTKEDVAFACSQISIWDTVRYSACDMMMRACKSRCKAL